MMTSPDYPCNYPNNVNFTWIIKPGKIKDIVNFTILDLQAETKNGRSCYDYLQITRFDPCCITLIEGCTFGTYSIVVEGEHFQVSFISDESITKKGFMLLWQVLSPLKRTTDNLPSTPLSDASNTVNTKVTTTLSYETDAQTCEGDADIYSIYGILFLSMSGLSGMLVLVIVGIVSHYKKHNHRNHLQLMSGNTDYHTPEGRPDSNYAELRMMM
uniref:Deleted in malignant brain tumors 1 protein-like n=1 Tax=Crassostrea virginica TaxID=6565 RepID=A0A8B8A4P1_CRAVI|nr:deleted in malignant brain tumors 1 protein-like [Crassostrea virginica]